MKKIWIAVIITAVSLALIIAIVLGLFIHYLVGTVISYDYDRYEEITRMYDTLPTDFGEYEKRSFNYFQRNMIIFESHAYTVKLSYDKEEYAKEKKELDSEYSFHNETICIDSDEIEKEPEFDMGNFHFRIADIWEDGSILNEYPKIILFIGTNDVDNKIAYVFYEDLDQDFIYGSFEDFLRSECGWRN